MDLHRFAYRLTGNSDAAQDLVQETFLEAWRSIGNQSMPGRERAWLFSVLRHRWAHQRRDASRRIQARENADLLHDQAAFHVPVLERLVHSERLQTALDSLDPRFKEAFLMVFMEGMTCKEAAAALGVPLGTVLSRIGRAREAMRRTLGEPSTKPKPGSAEVPGK
jgi:RNA polymerase sigma-70 factor (ECF subfamily)